MTNMSASCQPADICRRSTCQDMPSAKTVPGFGLPRLQCGRHHGRTWLSRCWWVWLRKPHMHIHVPCLDCFRRTDSCWKLVLEGVRFFKKATKLFSRSCWDVDLKGGSDSHPSDDNLAGSLVGRWWEGISGQVREHVWTLYHDVLCIWSLWITGKHLASVVDGWTCKSTSCRHNGLQQHTGTFVQSLLQEDLKLRQVEEKLMSRRTKSSSDKSRTIEEWWSAGLMQLKAQWIIYETRVWRSSWR